ncbi:hypothetical protein HII31_06133 [Pseudocercospora fuligena]|uniref:Asl1-like glycosyl hydrolase catalytic domain-containing protein n=1 Tax=Pseudocercospora fuligena TaxID=685502 RepID=A0A8H6RKG6_9PEZI|nr:hypothetical protein HII31_06133 [Pseudocercospora fuligena]
MIKKRSLLWDWTNTDGPGHAGVPWMMDQVNFNMISSVSNWNTWMPPELQGRAPFRPMVRQEAQLTGQNWTNIENSDQPIIHFFNEPERQGISPEYAATIWNQKMLPLRRNRGKRLVSPSCSNDQNGQNWINRWMELVKANPPDYLGLHYYGADGNAMIAFLRDMRKRYPQQPVIISEWASISKNYQDVLGMTVQLCNFMDSQEWILEYALFGCMRTLADGFVSPAAQLMNPDGSFTELFRKYQSEVPMWM